MRKFYIMAALLLAALWSGDAWASVNFTATFDPSLLTTEVTSADGNDYTVVRYEGLYNQGEVGTPSLPMQLFHVLVPYNATAIRVTYTTNVGQSSSIEYPIYPEQQPVTTNALIDTITFTAPDPAYYNLATPLPAEVSNYVEDGFMFSENHIVTVAVCPVQYVPATGALTFYSTVDVTLDFVQTSASSLLSSTPMATAAVSSDYTALSWFNGVCTSSTNRGSEASMIATLVINPQNIGDFLPTDSVMQGNPNYDIDFPYYEYCVVAPEALAPAFDRLISWKRQKGYTAGVVTIESILNSTHFTCDPVNSSMTDDAAKLRAYLAFAYNQTSHKTQYVLLAGDHTNMPIRYGATYAIIDKQSRFYHIPTDLYFSEFQNDWDQDGDMIYGEATDKLQFYPSIFVGRLLCRSTEEVNNYIDKLLIYELNPGKGNRDYLNDALSTVTKDIHFHYDTTYYHHPGEIIEPLYNTTTVQEIMEGGEYPHGSTIIAMMNEHPYGFTSFHGHGNPGAVGVRDDSVGGKQVYAITALDAFRSYTTRHDPGRGLDKLTNFDYPQVSYSISCTTTPFDIFYENERDSLNCAVYNDSIAPCNFGRSYTSYGKYGGVAFFGNTRYGWMPTCFKMERAFIGLLSNKLSHAGEVEALSRIKETADRVSILTHNLIGCPEMRIWTAAPLVDYDVVVTRTNNGMTITGLPADTCDVGVVSCNGNIHRFTTSGTISMSNVSPNSVIVVHGHNILPKFSDAVFQNETVTQNNYFQVSSAKLGRAVDSGRNEGDFILSGATLQIVASGDLLISDGFVATNGANVVFDTPGRIVIVGGEISEGSHISLCAPEIVIEKNFNVSSNSSLELNYGK